MLDYIKTDNHFAAPHAAPPSNPSAYKTCRKNYSGGFTLIELVVIVAILGILAIIVSPTYYQYITKAKVHACAADIRTVEKAIISYTIDNNVLPDSLADVGMDSHTDPWKHSFAYQKVVAGSELQDIAEQPLNTDFDLYSLGADGVSTATPGNDPKNTDDIARSNDGNYVGLRP